MGDAALEKLDPVGDGSQIGGMARAQVVEHPDRPAFGKQRLGQVRTDEPGAAGYQAVFHGKSSSGTRLCDQAWPIF